MTIAIRAALLVAATLGWATAASAADFVTYRITTSGTGTRTVNDRTGTPTTSTLTNLAFDYTVPFADIAGGDYMAMLPGRHGLFFDGTATFDRIGSKLIIDDASLANAPGYAPFGFARGAICLAGASGTALPTGPIGLDGNAACGGMDLTLSLVTRDLNVSYTGAFTGLTAMFGDGTPDAYGIALAVPEPSGWALLLAGFALTGYALRRRRTRIAFA